MEVFYVNRSYTIALQPGMDKLADFLSGKGHKVCKSGACGIEPEITLISGVNMEWEQMDSNQCRIVDDESDRKMLLVNITGLSNDEILEKIDNNYCF